MANNKLERIKNAYKFLSLLESRHVKDARFAGDSAIIYYEDGKVFVIKGYLDEAMANKDFNYILEKFNEEIKNGG